MVAVTPQSAEPGRVAIVTGAALGLGRAIARELAAAGWSLVAVDMQAEQLAALAAELQEGGHPVVTVVADMTAQDTPAVVMAAAEEAFDRADALVNNAGIVDYAGFFDSDRAMLQRLLDVDVTSVYMMTQAFAATLRRRGTAGSVVNLGTSHAISGVAGTSAYAAAKGAVHAMSRALAVELADLGIRVNTLALGTTLTDRVRNDLPAELLSQRYRQIPLKRGAEPEEAARAVAFLLDAEYATGTELVLDGGFTVYGDG